MQYSHFTDLNDPSSQGDRLSRRHRRAMGGLALGFGFLSLCLLTTPVQALSLFWLRYNEYERCARDLLTTDLSDGAIADACAEALHPWDLSRCVIAIDQNTVIPASDALAGCTRVRRPEELATCVVDIDYHTQGLVPFDTLDYCRRSLLPLRFSECVVGLRTEITTLEPIPAMDVCISADNRPIEYLPDFVFSNSDNTPRTDPSIRLSPFTPPDASEAMP